MYPIQYLNKVPVDPPLSLILARLGFQKNKTKLIPEQEERIRKVMDTGILLCRPAACYVSLPIQTMEQDRIVLEGGSEFRSLGLQKLLEKSREAVLMAATVGKDVIERRDDAVKKKNGHEALVLDAVASEMTDTILDWLMLYINNLIRRQGRQLTRKRFSPGYGDFSLENQSRFFQVLDLSRLGLSLNPSMILVPEKSVTAVAGVEII